MTARIRTEINRNKENADDFEMAHLFQESMRFLVDNILTKDQEDFLNKHLSSKGNNWCDDGTYVRNVDAVQLGYGPIIGGDCFLKSFECYWKLRAIGAKRCCGIRTLIQGVDTDSNPHYWVESKDKVFDWGGGQEKIFNKERFYTEMGIINVREGNDMGCFRKDEYEVELERKTRYILQKRGVKALVEFIRETNWNMNRDGLLEYRMTGKTGGFNSGMIMK
jgi:hypothetical protein